ncbi:hypothetical protein ACO0QE_000378 [Hanseniaspora vineae]
MDDYTELPLKNRLTHKLWKARADGYEEVQKMINSVKSKPYANLLELHHEYNLVSFVEDTNVVALEKATCTVYKFLFVLQKQLLQGTTPRTYENVFKKNVAPIRDSLMRVVLLKCCNSSRKLTKEKALGIIKFMVQLDLDINFFTETVVSLISGNLKNVKNLNGFVTTISFVLSEFQVMPTSNHLVEPFFNALLKLSTIADVKIRQESFKIMAILDVCCGANKDVMQDLVLCNWKSTQLTEFNQKVKNLSNSQTNKDKVRFEIDLIKEQHMQPNEQPSTMTQANQNVDSDGDTVMNGVDTDAKEIDPFEIYTPTSILPDFDLREFANMLHSAKWKDRVETLQNFNGRVLNNVKKLNYETEDYTPIFQLLAENIAKDSNLQAVQLSVQAVSKMLDCLKYKAVHKYAHLLFAPMVERLKDKKINGLIFSTLTTLVDYNNEGLKFCLDELILRFLQHKILQVRAQSCRLLTELMLQNAKDVSKLISIDRLTNDILPLILKICNDSQLTIRKIGFENIAAFIVLMRNGREELMPILETKLDQLKLKEINKLTTELFALVKKQKPRQNQFQTIVSTNQNSKVAASDTFSQPESTLPSKRLAHSPLRKPQRDSSQKSMEFPSNNQFSHNLNRLSPAKTSSNLTNSSTSSQTSRNNTFSESQETDSTWIVEKKRLLSKISSLETENKYLVSQVEQYKLKITTNATALDDYKLRCSALEENLKFANAKIQNLQSVIDLGASQNSPKMEHTDSKPGQYAGSSSNSNMVSIPLSSHRSATTSSADYRRAERYNSSSSFVYVDEYSKNNNDSGTPTSVTKLSKANFSNEDLNKGVNSLKLNSRVHSETSKNSSPALLSESFVPPSSSAALQSAVTEKSWSKAEEVTRQLQARIEIMKAKTKSLSSYGRGNARP